MPEYQKKLFITFIVIAGIILGFFIFQISYKSKIYPRVTIADLNIGGLTMKNAQNLLEQKVNSLEKEELVVDYKDRSVKATLPILGLKINPNQNIKSAYSLGHTNNPARDFIDLIKSVGKNTVIVPKYEIEEEVLNSFLTANFGDLETKAINATLKYQDGDFTVVESKKGVVIDQASVKNQLKAIAEKFKNSNIGISLIEDQPEVREDETDVAYNQAHWLMDEGVGLTHNKSVWKVPEEKLANWIKFIPAEEERSSSNKVLGIEIDKSKVKEYLQTLAKEIDQQPVNAQLKVGENGKVEVFALSQEGRELKIEESANLVSDKLVKNESQINLIVTVTQSEVTTDNIENLGITSLIAKGESNFKGSPKNRRHNISVGTAKFKGVLVKPGEDFSFNTILGDVDAANGYLPELVIKKGKTVPEYGGGICQVSTTVFRAALNAGLAITERKNHAYVVKYYGTPGMDATIYPPHPDLRFKNDTPAHILIQPQIKGDEITFEFYGTNDGRETKLIGPNLYDAQPDGSVKAILYREIYKNNELVKKDTFRSNYASPANYPKQPFD